MREPTTNELTWTMRRKSRLRDWHYGSFCVSRFSGKRPSGTMGYYVRWLLPARPYAFKRDNGRLLRFRTFREARSFVERYVSKLP